MTKLLRDAVPIILLAMAIMLVLTALSAKTQTTELPTLSYQAFDQLAQVYKSGGTAPNLVTQMNTALELMEEASAKRAQGDSATAVALENQARVIIEQASPQILVAQQEATHNATARFQVVSIEAVVVVGISTVGFYGCLLIWRWYEKEKLLEMRIIAETTES